MKGTKIKLEYDSSTDSFKISVTKARVIRQVLSNNRGDQIVFGSENIQRSRHQSLNNCIFTTTTNISRSTLGIQKNDVQRLFCNSKEWMGSEASTRETPSPSVLAAVGYLSEALKNMPCMVVHTSPALSRLFKTDHALPAPTACTPRNICDDIVQTPRSSSIEPVTNVGSTK